MKLIEYFYCKIKEGYYFSGVFAGENLSYDLLDICTGEKGYRVGSKDIEDLGIKDLEAEEIIDKYGNEETKESSSPLDKMWTKEDILIALKKGEEILF
ncbi:hypothetical protein [Halonatronum saccharophilum]|uniref:hypothetical protein n=1 Tax=Halonatronum saccharophilum TaxID=150060 RepID=UPI00048886F7|nr:hypothetical protein [Halonatronum saccharophilum]